jgi:hypothetical protein
MLIAEEQINQCLQTTYITQNLLLRLGDDAFNKRILAFFFFQGYQLQPETQNISRN